MNRVVLLPSALKEVNFKKYQNSSVKTFTPFSFKQDVNSTQQKSFLFTNNSNKFSPNLSDIRYFTSNSLFPSTTTPKSQLSQLSFYFSQNQTNIFKISQRNLFDLRRGKDQPPQSQNETPPSSESTPTLTPTPPTPPPQSRYKIPFAQTPADFGVFNTSGFSPRIGFTKEMRKNVERKFVFPIILLLVLLILISNMDYGLFFVFFFFCSKILYYFYYFEY